MSFDTKYRPLQYEDVLGQAGTIGVLRQVVSNGTGFRQSYLFAGPYGTGKTTLGRLLARALLCDAPVEGNPCDVCPSCTRILKTGQSEAFIEIDAATNSGKDHIRRVVEDSEYATFSGKQRIWLFDESHQLTSNALDGLLKPMEDNIPGSLDKRLVCIFCTTEPEKMRTTVMSRSLNFQIKLVPPAKIAERLSEICTQENIAFEEGSLLLISELTECHVRDAIKLVESIGQGGEITKERVLKHLHLDKTEHFLCLAENLGTDLQACLQEVAKLNQLLPPRSCYENFGHLLQQAWSAGIGLGGVPRYLPSDRLKAIYTKHQDALLWMAEYLAKRPARLTGSLWSIDVALLHKRLQNPSFGQPVSSPSVSSPSLAPKTPEPVSQALTQVTAEECPAEEVPAPKVPQPTTEPTEVPQEAPEAVPVPKQKERDPMEPFLGTVQTATPKERPSAVPFEGESLESNLALASKLLRDYWISLEQERNGERST